MLRTIFSGVLFALCCGVASGDDGASIDERYVKVLTDKNFDKNVKKDTLWLVEFYAPWCGHCKNLQPVWAEAARKLASENSSFRLAKIDATENPSLTRRFSISGYPSIKFFKNGKNRGDYPGGRTKEEILKFAGLASQSALVNIPEGDGLHNFIGSQDISFVLVGVGAGNVPTTKAFDKIAEDETVLGVIGFATASEVDFKQYMTEEDLDTNIALPALVVFNTGEVSHISSRSSNPVKLDQANMEQFVKSNSKQLFGELSPSKPTWKLTKEGKKSVLAFVDPSKDASEGFLKKMRSIMRQYKDKLVFGWVDGPSNTYLLDPIGLKQDSLPQFVVVDITEMTFFKPSWASDEAEIKTYLDKVLSGKETAHPINQDKGDKEKPKDSAQAGTVDSAAVDRLETKLQEANQRVNSLELRIAGFEASAATQQLLTYILGGVVLVVAGLALVPKSRPAETHSSKKKN